MTIETCKKTVKFSGTTYNIGDPIEIDDANEVTRLKKLGALVDEVDDATAPVVETGGGEDDDAEAATLDQIVDAVGRVDEDDLNQDGSPKISAVRELLGDLTVDVTALKEATDYIALQNAE